MGDIMRGGVFRTAALLLTGFLTLQLAATAQADDRQTIDANTKRAMDWLHDSGRFTSNLVRRAAGVLVFPDMVEMGFGVGGEFGEGALIVDGKTVNYYAIAGTSFDFDASLGYKAEVIVFKTEEALAAFQQTLSWKVGEHANVPMIVSADKAGESVGLEHPVVGVIFTDSGLVTNLNLHGSKVTRIAR